MVIAGHPLPVEKWTNISKGGREWRMLKTNCFLFIGGSDNDLWYQIIQEALSALGSVKTAREVDTLKLIRQQDYDLIVIDATKVEDAFLLTSCIRLQRPNAKIVIGTTLPTWEQAREAFRAGVIDYIQKSMNKEETVSTIKAALDKTPPPWQHM